MSSITSHGYRIIFVGKDHPLAHKTGYAYEHRIVASNILGRPLLRGELIHHRDGNKLNNSIDNLLITLGIAEHKLHHRIRYFNRRLPNEINYLVLCSCGCGKRLHKYDNYGRPRKYIKGHEHRGEIKNPLCCDKTIIACACGCGGKFEKTDSSGRPRRYISGHNLRKDL